MAATVLLVLAAAGMSEASDRLKQRTFQFALEVIELARTFPKTEPGPTVCRQLTRSATSVGANYRAACRARSHAEFTSRIALVAEEADESQYWGGGAGGARLTIVDMLAKLQEGGSELRAIFPPSSPPPRQHLRRQKPRQQLPDFKLPNFQIHP